MELIRLREFGPCATCKAQMKTKRAQHEHLEQIGLEVHDADSLTVYSYHQCRTCGDVWEQVEDRDPGGKGKYLSPMRSYEAGPADWS